MNAQKVSRLAVFFSDFERILCSKLKSNTILMINFKIERLMNTYLLDFMNEICYDITLYCLLNFDN